MFLGLGGEQVWRSSWRATSGHKQQALKSCSWPALAVIRVGLCGAAWPCRGGSLHTQPNAVTPTGSEMRGGFSKLGEVKEGDPVGPSAASPSPCSSPQIWNDYKLKWNPSDYDGAEFMRVPAQKIWKPDIVLYNK